MALMKSGWLWRQSSVFKRWKLNWCDLWIDGNFICYKTESRRDYETRVSLKSKCVAVKSGVECTGVNPPEGRPRENLLALYLRDGSTIVMCANNGDEALYPPYLDTSRPMRWDSAPGGPGSAGRHGDRGGTAVAFVDALLVMLRKPH
ncbi:hypothetical protein SKAU_G00263820 [Synaphobranchus kaupii]|uniref:PH domain-containing protein n=1 Tax=Synaphobranchus kaupii TaxID=118154 RepID=A0A9Q1EYZ7_SYNKA|nr:hypothetical protein SKAU_G00263820 [Synaphobranchus kaupii]